MMAWRPGPQPSGSGSGEYDERDPWTQRFISKTDDGELSLDVNVRERSIPSRSSGEERFMARRCVPRAYLLEKIASLLCRRLWGVPSCMYT